MKRIDPVQIYKNRLLQHLLFWIVSTYVLLHLFATSGKIEKIDFLYTFLFQITLIPGIYINLCWLIPVLLGRKKMIFFIGTLILVIAGTAFMNLFFFDALVDFILPGYYFISYYEFTDIAKFVTVYILVTSLIKLAKSWFVLSEADKQVARLQKEKTEIELKALKAQVNPHFLFNSLNVLYSLALKKSEESPDVIVKLSDILRYVIYESGKEFVALSDEVKLIQDYLDLQRYRIESKTKVTFITDIKEDHLTIAPMLFLPLVENSFKHGVRADIRPAYVDIILKADSQEIQFEIENNKGNSGSVDVEKPSGIGLSNIKNRLSLLYPSNHLLEINESDTFFRIKLIIRNENQMHYRG
jgi:sensor histidine kinase YesM